MDKKICNECGEVFVIRFFGNNPAKFCSKKCHGRWLGKNHGRGRRYRRGDSSPDSKVENEEMSTYIFNGKKKAKTLYEI